MSARYDAPIPFANGPDDDDDDEEGIVGWPDTLFAVALVTSVLAFIVFALHIWW